MKFIIFMIIFFNSFVIAQSDKSSRSYWGIKGAIQRSNFSSPDIDNDSKIDSEHYGINAGFFKKIQLNSYFSAQTELTLSMKGHKNIDHGSPDVFSPYWYDYFDYYERNYRLDYIQCPLFFKFYPLADSKSTYPFFYSGAFAAYNINAKCDYEVEYLNGEELSGTFEITDVKPLAYGLLFGAGVEAPYKKVIIEILLNYELGLSKISDSSDYKINIWSATIGIGYNMIKSPQD